MSAQSYQSRDLSLDREGARPPDSHDFPSRDCQGAILPGPHDFQSRDRQGAVLGIYGPTGIVTALLCLPPTVSTTGIFAAVRVFAGILRLT